MTEKDLNSLYHIEQRIKNLKYRIAELEAETGLGSQVIDGMPHVHSGNSAIEQLIIKKCDLLNDLNKELSNKIDEERKIRNYISSVDDEEVKLIIELRFIKLKGWEKIGEELFYDPRTVARKMRKYLKTH